MEEKNVKRFMKHNNWVVFYILAILGSFFFALFSTGILNINLPVITIMKPSPDATVSKVRALCNFGKYESIAVRSLKFDAKTYSRITREEISENDLRDITGYLASAKSLCGAFDTSRKVEKKKVSDSEWEYRYYAGILWDSNRAYSIIYFDDDWRFVLPKWLSM